MPVLFQSYSPALSTLFGSIDGHAKSGAPVFCGSAGSITKRQNQHGVEFYVHRFYGGDGRQRETYIGTAEEADPKIVLLRRQIEEVKAVLPEIRLLVREGFQSADPKTYATLASLHQHGLFAAGATLIGSHSFGVLVNQMGIRATAYLTEDVDVARRGAHDEIRVVGVPELKAHATALPYLAYLLGQTQMATLISREGFCPVRIPVAERFAVHKLLVSQLRTHRDAKSEKDIFQAAVILAALGEKFPGAIEVAVLDTPHSARRHLANTLAPVLTLMQEHPRAAEEFEHAVTLDLRE